MSAPRRGAAAATPRRVGVADQPPPSPRHDEEHALLGAREDRRASGCGRRRRRYGCLGRHDAGGRGGARRRARGPVGPTAPTAHARAARSASAARRTPRRWRRSRHRPRGDRRAACPPCIPSPEPVWRCTRHGRRPSAPAHHPRVASAASWNWTAPTERAVAQRRRLGERAPPREVAMARERAARRSGRRERAPRDVGALPGLPAQRPARPDEVGGEPLPRSRSASRDSASEVAPHRVSQAAVGERARTRMRGGREVARLDERHRHPRRCPRRWSPPPTTGAARP